MKKRFLFLGNSHTYFNDMPELFRRMCEESGFCEAEVQMQAFPYVTYEKQLEWETSLRFAMVYGRFDYLIMQQAAHSPCPSKEETLRDGCEIIRQARSLGITPVQILPWAEKRLPEHQIEINEIYRELSKKAGIGLIPAGAVFERARETEDIPDLYWQDGEHGSPWGSYAVAAAIFSFLSGRSPVGLKNEALSFAKVSSLRAQESWQAISYPLEPDSCRKLQELVWQCVEEEKAKKAAYEQTSFKQSKN